MIRETLPTVRFRVRTPALAWLLFIVLFALTWIQFRTSRQWVYYAGEK